MLFFLSSIQQPPPIPSAFPLADKGVHGGLYAGLAVVLLRALSGARWSGVTLATVLASAAGATLYGISDEIHQLFVPGRQYDTVDMIADGIGASIAVVAILAWGIIRRRAAKANDAVRESADRA